MSRWRDDTSTWMPRTHAESDPVCRQFMTMPGVGAIVALMRNEDAPGQWLVSYLFSRSPPFTALSGSGSALHRE